MFYGDDAQVSGMNLDGKQRLSQEGEERKEVRKKREMETGGPTPGPISSNTAQGLDIVKFFMKPDHET